MDFDAKIQELQKQIKTLQSQANIKKNVLDDNLPIQVTACIMVASDKARQTMNYPVLYLAQTLRMLEYGAQSIPIAIIIQPVEPDRDNINGWLKLTDENPDKWPAAIFPKYTVLDPIPARNTEHKNRAYAYDLMMDRVDTEFVYFADPDTEPQPGVIFDLMRELENDPKLGMIGAQYDPHKDHVCFGCAMMRTKVAKSIEWQDNGRCVDSWLCHEELPRLGLTAQHLETHHRYARHLVREA